MDANVDIRQERDKESRAQSTLHDMIRKHHLEIAGKSSKDEKFTWKRNKQKDSSASGFLDFVLTKNLNVLDIKVGDYQGNSDHKALEVSMEYKGIIRNRILSKVNRRLLKNFTTDY